MAIACALSPERPSSHALFERRDDAVHREDKMSGFSRDMTDEAQHLDKSERGKEDASFRRVHVACMWAQ